MPHDMISTAGDRPLPMAADTEQVLLGAVILEPHLFSKLNRLTVADFQVPFHRGVFAAMLHLDEENSPIDAILIGEFLNESEGQYFGKTSEVNNLTRGVPIELNIPDYIDTLKEKTARRDAFKRLNALQLAVADGSVSVKELVTRIGKLETDLRDTYARQTDSFRWLGEILHENVIPTLDQYYRGEKADVLVSTGFPKIDDLLNGGIYRSDFVAIVAPPKSAKSAFALQLVSNIVDQNEVVGLLSLEMSDLQNGMRFISQASYKNSINKHGSPIEAIDAGSLRPGMHHATFVRAVETAVELSDKKILVCQQPLEWQELKRETRRLVKEKKMTVLVVDYWQLVFNARRGTSRADLLAEVAKGLKQLAQELNIIVVALGQFNQEGLKHKANGQELNAQLYLEGSGELAKSANIVLTLDIEPGDEVNKTNPRRGKMIFKPLRSSPDGKLDCYFFGKYLTVEID